MAATDSAKPEKEKAEQEPWISKLMGAVTPGWKNTYLRISILSLLLLNVDSIALLFSNYKLHAILNDVRPDGSGTFRYYWAISLCPLAKIGVALVVPAVWLGLNILTSWLLSFHNREIAKYEKETTREHAHRLLRDENKLLSSKLEQTNLANSDKLIGAKREVQEASDLFRQAYAALLVMNDILAKADSNYPASCREAVRSFKENSHGQQILDQIFGISTAQKMLRAFSDPFESEAYDMVHNPNHSAERMRSEMADAEDLDPASEAVSYEAFKLAFDASKPKPS